MSKNIGKPKNSLNDRTQVRTEESTEAGSSNSSGSCNTIDEKGDKIESIPEEEQATSVKSQEGGVIIGEEEDEDESDNDELLALKNQLENQEQAIQNAHKKTEEQRQRKE